jgi:hypothetical protein
VAGWIGDDVLNHQGFDAALEKSFLEEDSPGGKFGATGDVHEFVQEGAEVVVIVVVWGDGDGVGAVLIAHEGVAGLQFLDLQLHHLGEVAEALLQGCGCQHLVPQVGTERWRLRGQRWILGPS